MSDSATTTRFAATLEAYERWAPRYPATAHNPLMRAEEAAMLELWPDLRGQRVLDLACGTGRYSRVLAERGAAEIVALDVSSAMLRQVAAGMRVHAGMMALPFAPQIFAAVICGLALGHADDVERWTREVARVLAPGGTLLYSDFHPEAHAAGLVRSFKDEAGRTWEVPHRSHCVATQRAAVQAAGLANVEMRELRVGREVREPFPGSEDFYSRWDGLPLVLIVSARH